MTEFGIILWPDTLLELMKIHNPGLFPTDAKGKGFSWDADEGMMVLDFVTGEDMGDGFVPVAAWGDRLKIN